MSAMKKDFPGGTSCKEPACQCRRHKRLEFNPWGRKIPYRRKWQPTPIFFPGKSHGRRNLVGYSPWGRKESDMTERHLLIHVKCLKMLWNGSPERLLLLLLSRFSRVWLLATPQTAAYQVPPSMGFSRKEYWSEVPLPSPTQGGTFR